MTKAAEFRNHRKGKVKMTLFYRGKHQEARSKEDVIQVAKLYFSRWKIEEYFRCKKQMFQFENFRVRKLASINALKVSIIQRANPIKGKVFVCYYRLAKGISGILSYTKEGVRLWFRTRRSIFRQLCLKLII